MAWSSLLARWRGLTLQHPRLIDGLLAHKPLPAASKITASPALTAALWLGTSAARSLSSVCTSASSLSSSQSAQAPSHARSTPPARAFHLDRVGATFHGICGTGLGATRLARLVAAPARQDTLTSAAVRASHSLEKRGLGELYKHEPSSSGRSSTTATLYIPDTLPEGRHYGTLWVDNVFPLKIHSLDLRSKLVNSDKDELTKLFTEKFLAPSIASKVNILDVTPRLKDGGMFVHYTVTDDVSSEDVALACHLHSKENGVRAWFNQQRVRIYDVEGIPFNEDILSKYPTTKIRVEWQGPDPSLELFYEEFRPYGQIYDITINPVQPNTVRSAIVQYVRIRSATSARNCLHGKKMGSVSLTIRYELTNQTNFILQWITSHPRITVPILLAVLGALTYAIFDPLRVFFITNQITHRFSLDQYSSYQWLQRETLARLKFLNVSDDDDEKHDPLVWSERRHDEHRLSNWLKEHPDTFLFLNGPKGSGKSALLKTAIRDRKYKIVIHCDRLAGQSENEVLSRLASSTGFFPSFTWLLQAFNLADSLMAAATGQRLQSGTSNTTETQLKKILECTAIALSNITSAQREAAAQRAKNGKTGTAALPSTPTPAPGLPVPPPVAEKQPANPSLLPSPELAPTLGLHPVNQPHLPTVVVHDDEGRLLDSEAIEYPVVVIDGFYDKDKDKNQLLYDRLAEWAALLVETHIAHVVFVSNNTSAVKPLAKALPNKAFETISLSDASSDAAVSYVKRGLDHVPHVVAEDIPTSVAYLGGRLTDLQLLVQKVKAGMTAREAVSDIVQRAIVEVRKYGLAEEISDANPSMVWSRVQLWYVIQLLAQSEDVSFDEIKYSPYFKGDDKALFALERAELINVVHGNGRPLLIRAGKPVYRAAFREMIYDTKFSAGMDLTVAKTLLEEEDKRILGLENELKDIALIYQGNVSLSRTLQDRQEHLLERLHESQAKAAKYYAQLNAAKATLKPSPVSANGSSSSSYQ
ncbi:hypothetical protein CAOG_04628 [Capsaspora owczarzaki ATCC 30864]|uniref:Mitochondrial escape protein 2 n=1 Tax=Capsaspora owczarzaki (strain ATCC 30864) TaxID=595528 RepID=A0A0D2WQF7_CAPO3|nr:hypothetical protein CAOG_04628 [Capsaspora owczarzaki ATCC 30864]KJE93910.1 hypothetical protein CAOG_004628 [Capsaspora owczarzaki ATCC 30864]|eukprot:XP_004347375.1 hypothetical protein CAOG_04628 [Capsaspora owczarzaki ATCC 30864]